MLMLIIDDEINVRKSLAISLEADGHAVSAVGNLVDAESELSRRVFDLCFVDLRLGAASGMDFIPVAKSLSPSTAIVMITAHGSIDTAVDAIKRGADDFITKPFTPAQVRLIIERIARQRQLAMQLDGLQARLGAIEPQAVLTSNSPEMNRVIEMAKQVAPSDATVLLRGESGTGKGVLAQAIHHLSDRRSGPFSTVSCPSLSAELLESELFGHVKGAFTGAVRDHPGRIAATDSGTLFLDEIGDLPSSLQPKLLRFLQEKRYERVGDTTTRQADVRIICATNVDLAQAVKEKRFREDLYYRINVFPLQMPALRDRRQDIMPLAEAMLAHFRKSKRIQGFSDAAATALTQYGWPGNVRELKNAIERAVILCSAQTIDVTHLPGIATAIAERAVKLGDLIPFEKIEEAHIRRVLANTHSLEEAAKALDVDVATLWRKRKKYGI